MQWHEEVRIVATVRLIEVIKLYMAENSWVIHVDFIFHLSFSNSNWFLNMSIVKILE